MRKSKIICIDIETTGLDFTEDEVLQVSIINGNGKTLYNSYIRPKHKTSWEEAERIHKIGWEAVRNAPTLKHEKKKIEKILQSAELIIGYNEKGFDLPFMAAKGIDTSIKAEVYDVMLEFAYIYGEYNKYRGNYKWQKLTTCADYYGFTNYRAHDALEDVRATLHCYYAMLKDKKGQQLARKRKEM